MYSPRNQKQPSHFLPAREKQQRGEGECKLEKEKKRGEQYSMKEGGTITIPVKKRGRNAAESLEMETL